MNELNARLKLGKTERVHLLFGPEVFLTLLYEKRIISAVLGETGLSGTAEMNTSRFEGKNFDFRDIRNASETPPFFSNSRLMIIKDSGLLQAGRKDDSELLAAYIPEIPETSTLLFVETKEGGVDKRTKLYKKIAETGMATEFVTPSESELADWLVRLLKSKGKTLPKPAAYAMIRQAVGQSGPCMELLHSEAQKLAAFLAERQEATIADVSEICTKSVEAKIFDIVKDIGCKDMSALVKFADMMHLKEPPLMALNMIARQFRMILICGGLSKSGLSQKEISNKTGLRDFIVRDCIKQSGNFTEPALINALFDCLDADASVKTGKMPDRMAVEALIVKYCL